MNDLGCGQQARKSNPDRGSPWVWGSCGNLEGERVPSPCLPVSTFPIAECDGFLSGHEPSLQTFPSTTTECSEYCFPPRSHKQSRVRASPRSV